MWPAGRMFPPRVIGNSGNVKKLGRFTNMYIFNHHIRDGSETRLFQIQNLLDECVGLGKKLEPNFRLNVNKTKAR